MACSFPDGDVSIINREAEKSNEVLRLLFPRTSPPAEFTSSQLALVGIALLKDLPLKWRRGEQG